MCICVYIYIYIHNHIDIDMCICLHGFQTGSGQTGFPQKGHNFRAFCNSLFSVLTGCHMLSHVVHMLFTFLHGSSLGGIAALLRRPRLSRLGPLARRNATAHLPTNIVDLRGFDSSIMLFLRGGILMSIRNFPDNLSQAFLVGIMLVGRLGELLVAERSGRHGGRGRQPTRGAAGSGEKSLGVRGCGL